MTLAECDSTTELSCENGCLHAHGCTGMGAPCTGSLLRLALVEGSAHAIRFTTCIIDNSSRRFKERSRHSPYQKKKKYGAITRLVSMKRQIQEISVDIVSSSAGFIGENARVELMEGQVCVDFQSGTEGRHSAEIPKPFDKMQNFLNPLRTISGA